MKLLSIVRSRDKVHKFIAAFEMDDGAVHKIRFGAIGYDDYTTFPATIRDERREAYLGRHKAREEWNEPDNAGSLARWLLWEYPSMRDAIKAFKKRFTV